jgi:tellurite resistance protein
VAVVVVLGILAALPKGLLIALGVLGLAAVLIYLFFKNSQSSTQQGAKTQVLATAPLVKPVPATAKRGDARSATGDLSTVSVDQDALLKVSRESAHVEARDLARSASAPINPQAVPTKARDERTGTAHSQPTTAAKETMVSVTVRVDGPPKPVNSFRIPDPPAQFGQAQWIPANHPVTVAGVVIPGGLIYVGMSLSSDARGNDPCLIDPSKHVSSQGDYRQRQMDYWPSYSNISPTARRAYLNWLASGREDPDADIGFVFLFFYGLERRILVDSEKDPSARADWPAVRKELGRLCSIYSDRSGSFRRYASSLLGWMAQADMGEKAYLRVFPAIERGYELPFEIRLALGQAAADKVPVPANLALAWAKLHPGTNIRTPASRCASEFDKLFVLNYQKAFGQGMVVPPNRTKLRLSHYPASSAFQNKEQVAPLSDIPDVSVLTGPIKKLHKLVEETTKELEVYSRFVGKNPELRNALEGLLLLPPVLWPDASQTALQALKVRMGEGMLVMSFQELLHALEVKSTLTKEKVIALARALESLQIGLEPDVLDGSKLPRSDDQVALFAIPPGETIARSTSAYQAAALTLQLASAVANADGDFCAKELAYLHGQVETWTHLAPNQIRRLLAHLRLLHAAPASLTALRAKIEPLDTASKESIARFMAKVAQADGVVSPEEIKLLEKLYKSLGIESTRVFSDVHAAASGMQSDTRANATTEGTGFKLDANRIAALQRDTEAVTALLSNIFQEEPPSPELAEADAEPDGCMEGLLGLDEQHSALARLLLTRVEWSREELDDAVADLDLMIDGALETLNEAAFDKHDIPFVDGDNPVVVNPELLEKLEA